MRLLLAFLAEHAIAHDDGRFYALGGGIEEIDALDFPSEPRNLTLLVRLGFDQDEIGRQYAIEVAGIGPEGKAFIPSAGVFVDLSKHDRHAPRVFQFAHQLSGTRFALPGPHYFTIRINGSEIGRVDLNVRKAGEGEPGTTLVDYMRRGYAAFSAGNIDEAERLFAAITQQFPESAHAHNNLGFARLVLHKVEPALRSFEIAQQIGFEPEQIVRANIACCHFLLNRPKEALEEFAGLMGGTFAAGGTVLVALGRKAYHLVQLGSPTDFVVLMALNAGRCAIGAKDYQAAQTFHDVSRASDFGVITATVQRFKELRAQLEEDLRDAQVGRTQ